MITNRRLRDLAHEAVDNEATVIVTTEEMRWLLSESERGKKALEDEQGKTIRPGTEVSCPRCGAKRGEKCRSESGRTDMNYWHRARIEKKKRKK